MSGVTINGKQYGSIEEYMEEINPTIVEPTPEHIEDWIYVIEDDGTITINGYKGLDTEVVIPNYINGIPVKKIGKVLFGYSFGQGFWDPSICEQGYVDLYFYRQNTITKVVISYGIETIDSMALNHSNALQEIVIPKTVKNIRDRAFWVCNSLKEITIPSSVTSIESGVFNHCTSLTEITIPSSVTSIGSEVFSHCTSLTEITIPSSVTSIGSNAFWNCTSLTEITIPDSVTTMGERVFNDIPSITVHVPWREGEKPEGWSDNWNSTNFDCTITVDYAK